MKLQKLKISKVIILSVALLLMLSFVLSMALSSAKQEKETYTVCSDDGYYSETTYFTNEAAYDKYLQENVTQNKSANVKVLTSNSLSSETPENGEFVQAAVKKVWYSETEDENGIATDSRLLKKAEVEQLNNALMNENSTELYSGATVVPPTPTEPPKISLVGSDSESFHLLSISMKVYRDRDTKDYTVNANASWVQKLMGFWDTDRAAEEDYLDYIGISWGGEGLKTTKQTISGKYRDWDVDFSRAESNPYAGYVWQFHEKSKKFGKEMKNADAEVVLHKEGGLQNKYTCVQMTYIHTYGKVCASATVGITVSKNPALAASISLSEKEKNWQIQIAVGDIEY